MPAEASVTVIVVELEDDPYGPGSLTPMVGVHRPFYAYMASNPEIRADGITEEDALARLKHQILNRHPPAKRRRAVDLRLDELIVEEVMGG